MFSVSCLWIELLTKQPRRLVGAKHIYSVDLKSATDRLAIAGGRFM